MKRAVLYLRLSSISEDSTSIERQRADLQGLAEREGWDVVETLTDDGISGRKARANAAAALRMLRDGEADVLAVWKLDRWTRQGLGAIGALADTLDATPGATFVAMQDGLRSNQPAWRLIAAVLSEVARTEADNTAKRVASSIAHRRTVAHRYTGGATIPFGFDSVPAPDGVGRVLVHDPEEAVVVREIARRLLESDVSLTKLAIELTARGVPTSRSPKRRARKLGKPDAGLDAGLWRAHTVKDLVTQDLALGRVTHRGALVRDEDGLPATVWEPLLDRATVERLRARYADAKRGPVTRVARKARLLSGVAFCGHCDSKLWVSTQGSRPIYQCAKPREYGECTGYPRVDAVNLEALVVSEFLAFRGPFPEMREEQTVDSRDDSADLQDVEAALREATAALLEDDADPAALMRRIDALKARRTELRASAASATVTTRLVPTGRTLADAWHADEDLDRRRAVLLEALDHVAILKSTSPDRRSRALDRERVVFRWSDEVEV
ncbi:hypothetical protein BIU98_04395 [Curtobacterium sp. MMLR14_010]|uniref:recombinase family protein n=1 Tax=Curtobacterium sp. MMLR14_010 TaxID=1898743 RepID=UPI0008DCDE75|nr:recombinase family protein [Curtobacterium sp. MMLR14_010]OII35167.1 hypothetical protein BIU98_04395 [Curtobacterium sp. MMLR14_010]